MSSILFNGAAGESATIGVITDTDVDGEVANELEEYDDREEK